MKTEEEMQEYIQKDPDSSTRYFNFLKDKYVAQTIIKSKFYDSGLMTYIVLGAKRTPTFEDLESSDKTVIKELSNTFGLPIEETLTKVFQLSRKIYAIQLTEFHYWGKTDLQVSEEGDKAQDKEMETNVRKSLQEILKEPVFA